MITLETERLILRPLIFSDEPALSRVLGDPEAMRWYPRPWTHEEIVEWLGRQFAMYEETATGKFGVVIKASGELIGDCGATWFEVAGRQELEIGYRLRKDQWGNGFATEAARRVLDYAHDALSKIDCISLIRPGNLPSRRVAEKNGAQLEKIVYWRDYDHCVYRYGIPRDEDHRRDQPKPGQ
jgi:ribosomal-protein-alanine N-acetyltransferase